MKNRKNARVGTFVPQNKIEFLYIIDTCKEASTRKLQHSKPYKF